MFLKVGGCYAAGVPEMMTPQRVVSDEADGQGGTVEKGVHCCCGFGRRWVVVLWDGEEVESAFVVGVCVGHGSCEYISMRFAIADGDFDGSEPILYILA